MKSALKAKICGITNLDDARKAAELGAWALGFIFFDRSPRYITPERAREIIEALPAGVRKVGVFVNAAPDAIRRAQETSGIDTVQFHGNEALESCASFAPYFKALRLARAEDLPSVSAYPGAEAILLDAAVSGEWGGTGKLSDWDLAARATPFGKIILSGGLDSENVSRAITRVKPFAVDVSSGVEEKPGKKDHRKLTEFFRALANVYNDGGTAS